MPRPARCPPELTARVFRGSDAVAQGLITPNELRSSAWQRLVRDVYVHRDAAGTDAARLDALRLVTDADHVVCGRTAAWLFGVWRPVPGACVPLEVTRPKDRQGRDVEGQGRRRLTLRSPSPGVRDLPFPGVDEDVVELDGIAVTSPMRTCLDLMRERRLVEAVVVADAFLHAGLVGRTCLAVYCANRYRWPGIRRARVAVGLSSAFARSPGESRLRMLLVLAGFEEPLVNAPVVDAWGMHVATPDLQVRGQRWAWLEYDGAYHDEADQHAGDLRRENRLAVASGGVPVLRYDKRHLGTTAARELALSEVTRSTRARRLVDLDHRDFVRPSRPRAW